MEKYSVLMSVYDRENAGNLRQAIESMLCQTTAPDEFVLVCDGPLTRELDEVIAEYEAVLPELLRVVRLDKNCGLGTALAKGMEECRFDWIARMDSDDIAVPDRIEHQFALLQVHPDASAIGGQIAEFFDDTENVIGYRTVCTTAEEVRKTAKFRNPMNHMTVLLKKKDIQAVGGYQPFPQFEDYHLWTRLIVGGYRLYNVDGICCNVRVNRAFYGRRGGMDYFLKTVKMQQYLKSCGLINGWEYWRNILLRFAGTVLLPEKIRGKVFVKAMRKNKMCNASG